MKERVLEGFSELVPEKHGVGGLIKGAIEEREQDAIATSWEGYVVAFFPKVKGIGAATIAYAAPPATLAQTPETAIAKFLDDHMSKGRDWASYEDAGYKVRKVRIEDLGEAYLKAKGE